MRKQWRWPERLKAHIDTRAIIAAVIAGIILLIIVVVVSALTGLADSVWEDAEDVLQDKVRVWQALAASAAVLLAAGVATMALRRLGQRGEDVRLSSSEVLRFDVLWPMTGVIDLSTLSRRPSRFKAGKPMCPSDRTPLGWVLFRDEGEDMVVALPDNDWHHSRRDSMLFACLECGTRYDLRKYGYGMARAIEIVEEIALGKYRMSMEAARTGKRG